MIYPGGKDQHLRHLLFFAFQGQKAAKDARDICNVYGDGVLCVSTAQKWFSKFKNDDFDLKNPPRSGGPWEIYEDGLKALLKEYGRQTTRDLAEKSTAVQ